MLNKYKKSLLTFGTLTVALVPIATIISCTNKESVDKSKIVSIQAEKKWVDIYKSIIAKFKIDYKSEMEKEGIKDIEIVEAGSTESDKLINTKGIRDESLADVFLVQTDKFNGIKPSIREFSVKTFAEFATKYKKQIGGENVQLSSPAKVSQGLGTQDNKTHGIVQNVEGLIALAKKGETNAPTKTITHFSDLWFAAGYFNEKESTGYNLRDIVKTNTEGQIEEFGDSQKSKIVNGFKKLLTDVASLPGDLGKTAFHSDGNQSKPIINEFFKASTTTGTKIITGPWDITDGKFKGTEEVKILAPNNYNQWGGGYLFVMNNRINSKEQKIAEMLIAALLNPENAVELYNKIQKISPLAQGALKIKEDKDNLLTDAEKNIADAIYKVSSRIRPLDQAFGIIWETYAKLIYKEADRIRAVQTTGIDALADDLATKFIADVKSSVASSNTSTSS